MDQRLEPEAHNGSDYQYFSRIDRKLIFEKIITNISQQLKV